MKATTYYKIKGFFWLVLATAMSPAAVWLNPFDTHLDKMSFIGFIAIPTTLFMSFCVAFCLSNFASATNINHKDEKGVLYYKINLKPLKKIVLYSLAILLLVCAISTPLVGQYIYSVGPEWLRATGSNPNGGGPFGITITLSGLFLLGTSICCFALGSE